MLAASGIRHRRASVETGTTAALMVSAARVSEM
jgi:hypothetical protein